MDDSREYVTLDDPEECSMARNDPALFLQMHSRSILIDEVQYAPQLFLILKSKLITVPHLKDRKAAHLPADMQEIYRRIWIGSMPGLLSGRYKDRDVFYSSYLQTYIDRDVSELVNLTDKLIFMDIIRAAACNRSVAECA